MASRSMRTNSQRNGPSPTTTYLALLRGINVGGKNKLPMRELAAIFAENGCANLRTFIQSGNVVFTASGDCVRHLADRVTQQIAARFGFRSPVLVRTADELRRIVAQNPFLRRGGNEAALHVAFLADKPDPPRVAALDPQRSPGDSFELRGWEVYLYLPNGVARTKLTNAYLDATLATTSTLRNWRTVLSLLELTEAAT